MTEKDMIVCRCEEITYQDLVETAANYNCSARELKLRTRAGMGYCGGRTCRCMVDKIAATLESQKQTQITLKYQPPVRPISFGNLGGQEK
ncbi:(2Fe-2S)-binding protein [Virgibacillus dakarensis]|uniref:Pyridine nucleotide-disulfide oxidoreductase n=1 Tax=Lentibacillus populi TaxID=1827502 RepID=A0A9W5X5B5_9BACI|nr:MULTISPECIES: (2Fe-2S)-binding protein [Bacillaceae]MTW84502.1 (2Fe-2S)-binding protein [Virgibacillus dakarensis]GGB42275.1 pyridine nucleotide-disulfide oxidoreductase [Lentibacillus populi]